MKYKVGFIGCGNMGGVLLGGVIKNVEPKLVAVSEKFPEKVKTFLSKGVNLVNLKEVCENSEYVFLAVKPQVMESVLNEASEFLSEKTVLITMAAGLEISSIEKFVNKKIPVIRIMPNMPCSVNSGVVLYTFNNLIGNKHKEDFLSFLNGIAFLDQIEEDKIDVASVLSGCGPAFTYILIDAFSKSAKSLGLDEKKALLYTLKTMEGASKLVENSDKDIETLIDVVCSPKGTTIEGVEKMRQNDIYKILDEVVKASYNRSLELK